MSEEEIQIECNKLLITLKNHHIDGSIIQVLYNLYNKEKEKNKAIKEYIENKIYIDDNPTICGDEEDTITELPISLNLWNEDLRKLLELLEE